MNNQNVRLHYYQLQILKKLAGIPHARFNELLIEGLESEHMNYHLRKLIEMKFVQKSDTKYELTDKGKDYTNLMDDNIELVEKQPKTSILLSLFRKNEESGEIEVLLCRRLRQPYYGKVGRLTGKVRFGETFEQAAARELYEETGLNAGKIILEEIYHKLRYRPDGEFVQDVIFYIFFMSELSGTLIEKTSYQDNLWVSARDLRERTDLDLFDDYNENFRLAPKTFSYSESVEVVDGF